MVQAAWPQLSDTACSTPMTQGGHRKCKRSRSLSRDHWGAFARAARLAESETLAERRKKVSLITFPRVRTLLSGYWWCRVAAMDERGFVRRLLGGRQLSALFVVLAGLVVCSWLGLAPAARAAEGGRILGKVTAAATKGAIVGIEVCAAESLFEAELFGHCTQTNSGGEYTISGLPAGRYGIGFFGPEGSGLNYIPQYYNGKSSVYEAEFLTVEAAQTVSGINAAMEVGGQSKVVKVTLIAAGKRLLSSRHKLTTQLTTAQATGGHSTVLSRRTVTFKAPARHKHKKKG